jgi:hypothetical protein
MDNNSFAVGYVLGWKRGSDSGGGQPSTFDDIISNKIEIGTIYSDETYRITLNVWYTEEPSVRDIPMAQQDWNTTYPISRVFDDFIGCWYLMFITYRNSIPVCATICRQEPNTSFAPIIRGSKGYTRIQEYSGIYNRVWFKSSETLLKDAVWTFGEITNIAPVSIGGNISANKRRWWGAFEFKVDTTVNYRTRFRSYNSATGELNDWTYTDQSLSLTLDYTIAGGTSQFPLSIISWDGSYFNISLSELKNICMEIWYNVNKRYYTSQVVMPILIDE